MADSRVPVDVLRALPPGYLEIPPPAMAPTARLVERGDAIDIAKDRGSVVAALDDADLSELMVAIPGAPGVTGAYPLTDGPFGAHGTRRLVCLSRRRLRPRTGR